MKTFINSTGVYPVGTLVILDTLKLAVVSKTNPDVAQLHQPLVKIISDGLGVLLTTPSQVDLALDDRVISRPPILRNMESVSATISCNWQTPGWQQ